MYESESGSCLDWRVSNALARGPDADVAGLARNLAALAARDIDRFNIIESRLAYYGQLSVLVEATRLAWPDVESSSDIVPWGIDEFAARAVAYTILDHVARTAEPAADERALLDRLAPFMEIDPESLARHLAHLTGQAGRRWTLREFESGPTRRFRKDDDLEEDEAAANADRDIHELTVEFVGHLYRSARVPYTKGDLARRELCRFLVQRQAGKLERRESMMEAFGRRGRGKPKPAGYTRHDHPLIPDVDRLDQYLAGMVDFIFPQPYRAVALLEIVPSWLGFLLSRGLTDADSADAAISRLSPLAGQLRRLLDADPDPELRLALDRWPEFHEGNPTPRSRVRSSAEGRSKGPVQHPRQ